MPEIRRCVEEEEEREKEEEEETGQAAFHFDPRAADAALAAAEREAAALRAAGDTAGAERALRATTVAGVLETLRERDGADGDAFAGVYATVLGPSLRLRLGTDSWPEHYRAHLARMTYATLRARQPALSVEARGAYGLDEREALALRALRDSAFLPSRRAVLAAFDFSDPVSSVSQDENEDKNKEKDKDKEKEEKEEKDREKEEKDKDKNGEKEEEKEEKEITSTEAMEEAEKEAVGQTKTLGGLVRGLVPRHATRTRDAGAARKALQALERAEAERSVLCEPPGGAEGVGTAWRRTPVTALPDRRDVFWRFCADRRAPQYEVLTAEYVGALAAYIARRIRELAHRCPQYLQAQKEASETAQEAASEGSKTASETKTTSTSASEQDKTSTTKTTTTTKTTPGKTRKVFEFCVLEAGAGSGRLGHFLQEALDALLPATGDLRVRVVACDNFADRIYTKYPMEMVDVATALRAHAPTLVVCAWMPLGVDWTAAFRATRAVHEYLLVGPPETTGHPADTWACAANTWARVELRGLGALQLCRCDAHGSLGHSTTTSFRRPAAPDDAIAVVVLDVPVDEDDSTSATATAAGTVPPPHSGHVSGIQQHEQKQQQKSSNKSESNNSKSNERMTHTVAVPDLSDPEAALAEAEREKTVAAKLFRAGAVERALEHYERAEDVLRPHTDATDRTAGARARLRLQLATNCALCCLRTGDWGAARTHAAAAVALDPLCAKAHYLLGRSLLELACAPEDEGEDDEDSDSPAEGREELASACRNEFARARELAPLSGEIVAAEARARERLRAREDADEDESETQD